ncbi:MAG TPA: methionine aminotransferase [Spirochaetota bacterium]|nr:methionine aminotransferase [Spirochaetota bacterium]HPV41232.1 methionine aminotransferase [Spirochaetota bacterium]
MHVQSKLPDVGVTIFTVMSRLANEQGAINLSQGFPDFDVDPELIGLVDHYMRQGNNQYAPMQGVMALRERIAEKVQELYGASYAPAEEITVTSGGTEALFAAITAVVHHGDEAILFEPAYDSYAPTVALCGGRPVYCPMRFPGYSIDWDMVKDSITPRTRCIIINSPHNPSGAVLSPADIGALKQITAGTGIYIISDEVYEHILFDGLRHESMSRYPELAARSFVISSFGKTYHTTGWKIGYCLAPKPLSAEFQKIHQYLTFASNTPVQCAYAKFMENRDTYLSVPKFYEAKRDLFLSLVKVSRFKVTPSRGTYFQMLDYSDITDEADTAFARRMTVEHGVAAIPPSVFYHDGRDNKVLRFCFAKKDDTLEKAAERLCRI